MHNARITLASLLLAVLLLPLAAVGTAASALGATVRPAAPFPLVVHSADGAVTIPQRPTRILSLSASATQMLYAMGAGHQVVGVDKYSTYPPNAPRTAFTGYESSAEDYLPLHPDLVLLAFSTGTLVEQLHKLGIPTLLLPPASDLAAVSAQMAELGRATGHLTQALAVAAALRADLTRTAGAARSLVAGDTYYIELDPTLYTATSRTFVGSVFSLFGMRDIADAAARAGTYPQLSAEYLLKANPDEVVLADTSCCGQTPATFARRPGFSVLRAVKDHHVIAMSDSLASEWGPHSLETFVALLAHAFRTQSAAVQPSRP